MVVEFLVEGEWENTHGMNSPIPNNEDIHSENFFILLLSPPWHERVGTDLSIPRLILSILYCESPTLTPWSPDLRLNIP